MNIVQFNNTKALVKSCAETLLLILIYFIVVGLFQFLGFLSIGIYPTKPHLSLSTAQEMIISLFSFAGTYLLISFFTQNIERRKMLGLDFNPRDIFLHTIVGIVLGFFLILIGFTVLILMKEVQLTKIEFDFVNFTYSLLLFIFVSTSEELFVRGLILNKLIKSMHNMLALFISSIIFSFMHVLNLDFSWISFCNLLVSGILIGLLFIYTRSLLLPIAFHFSWNFFQGTIFGFNVSGHEIYSLIGQSRIENDIWNGGKFGFEGSLVCLVLQMIAILVLYFWNKKYPLPVVHLGINKFDLR